MLITLNSHSLNSTDHVGPPQLFRIGTQMRSLDLLVLVANIIALSWGLNLGSTSRLPENWLG